jgi:hypothetical protein
MQSAPHVPHGSSLMSYLLARSGSVFIPPLGAQTDDVVEYLVKAAELIGVSVRCD